MCCVQYLEILQQEEAEKTTAEAGRARTAAASYSSNGDTRSSSSQGTPGEAAVGSKGKQKRLQLGFRYVGIGL